MIYLIMGVSGCGKTRIGSLLAKSLRLPFYDADDFHPEDNIRKMKEGLPLDDADRLPWLKIIGGKIPGWKKQGSAVLACSALKEEYRIMLRQEAAGEMIIIHLQGPYALIQKRMKKRKNSFFKPDLLLSQFSALQEPADAITVSITQTPHKIVKDILSRLGV
jgi:carbohydrate kinase (thermoresistant glucokinase family)